MPGQSRVLFSVGRDMSGGDVVFSDASHPSGSRSYDRAPGQSGRRLGASVVPRVRVTHDRRLGTSREHRCRQDDGKGSNTVFQSNDVEAPR